MSQNKLKLSFSLFRLARLLSSKNLSNIVCTIYGLEALTNNDQEKLKREWLIKISELSRV